MSDLAISREIDHEEENREYLNHRIESLPEAFQKRIAGFRDRGLAFGNLEEYEIFVCEEAMKIASSLPSKESIDSLKRTFSMNRKRTVPDLAENHSRNSFEIACLLAKAYLESPASVILMHAAMCTYSGCRSCGCLG